MHARLILLVLLVAALVLSISSCGGEDQEFKPVAKTGALEGSAPDVVLFVLRSSTLLEGARQPRPASLGPLDKGVAFSSAYLRSPDELTAMADLHWLGKALTKEDKSKYLTESPLMVGMQQGGYATSIHGGVESFVEYMAEDSAGPRFAIVNTWSEEDWAASEKAVRSREQSTGQAILSVWTALTAFEAPEALTEKQLSIPLVFSMPGTLPEGQTHTQVVSLADVGPTILDLCGLIPEGTRFHEHAGASFARILQKKPLAWRGFVLAKTPEGAGWIRSTRWRLVRDAAGQQTLSYVEKNPLSISDDSALTGAPAQLKGLGGRLDAWLQ